MEEMSVSYSGSIPDEALQKIAMILIGIMEKEKALATGDQTEQSA